MNLESEIKEVYEKASKAFCKMDIPEILNYFSDSPSMVKISGGTVLRGKKELADYLSESFSFVKDLHIRVEDIEIYPIDSNHVRTVADEYISYNGENTRAVVSNIFVKTDKGWKILHDHTSPAV